MQQQQQYSSSFGLGGGDIDTTREASSRPSAVCCSAACVCVGGVGGVDELLLRFRSIGSRNLSASGSHTTQSIDRQPPLQEGILPHARLHISAASSKASLHPPPPPAARVHAALSRPRRPRAPIENRIECKGADLKSHTGQGMRACPLCFSGWMDGRMGKQAIKQEGMTLVASGVPNFARVGMGRRCSFALDRAARCALCVWAPQHIAPHPTEMHPSTHTPIQITGGREASQGRRKDKGACQFGTGRGRSVPQSLSSPLPCSVSALRTQGKGKGGGQPSSHHTHVTDHE